jgi:LacI family transcriptional regulator
MTTIKDIGRLANVSIAAVSKVVNGDYSSVSEATKERILKISKELNYKPNRMARGLVTSKTNILGLMVSDITNPFFAALAKGVEDRAGTYGYNVLLCNTDEKSEKEITYVDLMLQYNAAGVIVTSSSNPESEHILELAEHNTPFVSIDRSISSNNYSIFVDNFRGTYVAAEHLIKNGHTKLAFIGGEPPGTGINQRLNGYLQALRDYKIEENCQLVCIDSYHSESGYRNVNMLLNKGLSFTGVVCGNDLIAFGVIKALKERGLKIPEDISIIGFDDIYLSALFDPSLTTIRQPIYEMGSHAVDVLIRLIKGENVIEKVKYFGPELVERDSVANISHKKLQTG